MLSGTLWTLIGIPLLIFCARLVDVSLSTLRILLISRGMKQVAPFVGFFEVMIWLFAISQAMKHLDHWFNYVAYAGGFAAGTWLGFFFENRLALGLQSVQIKGCLGPQSVPTRVYRGLRCVQARIFRGDRSIQVIGCQVALVGIQAIGYPVVDTLVVNHCHPCHPLIQAME